MRRSLTWEDLDLLEIFSHQLGSYLTVEELARQVAEAEHFDRMSKHVTFVAHDLKNRDQPALSWSCNRRSTTRTTRISSAIAF